MTKAIALNYDDRLYEGTALMELSLQVALDGDVTEQALRAYYNLSDQRLLEGAPEESGGLLARGLALARERGDRGWERDIQSQMTQGQIFRGEWDEAQALSESLRAGEHDEAARVAAAPMPLIFASRGEVGPLHQWAQPPAEPSEWAELALMETLGQTVALRAIGRPASCEPMVIGVALELAQVNNSTKALFLDEVIDMLLEYERFDELEALTPASDRRVPAGIAGPLERARGRLAHQRGDTLGAEAILTAGVAVLRAGKSPFPLARGLLDLGVVLAEGGRFADAEPLLLEARSIFVGLRAAPWIERTRALLAPAATAP